MPNFLFAKPIKMSAALCGMLLAQSLYLTAPLSAHMPLQDADEKADKETLYKAAYEMARLQQGEPEFSDTLKANMTEQIRVAYSQVPEFAEIEKVSPGFVNAMVDTIMPIIIRQTSESYPDLYDRLARFYADKLTLEEIQKSTEFFATESYRTILESSENNLDITKVVTEEIEDDDDGNISKQQLKDLAEDAVTKSASGWDAKVRADLLKFGFSPAGRKISSLRDARNQIEVDWTNTSTPEADKELEEAIEKVILQYTETE